MKVKIINHIKELRKDKGMTQTQLADFVGVSKNAISEFERGNYLPALDTSLLICKALDSEFQVVFEYNFFTEVDPFESDFDVIQLSLDVGLLAL